MTKVQNPIIGRATKQSGGMIFSTLYGSNVMRSRPASYRDANSEDQKSRREIMTFSTKIISSLKFYLSSFFVVQPSSMSAYSKILSQFLKMWPSPAILAEYDTSLLLLGQGNVPQLVDIALTSPTGTSITAIWVPADQDPLIPQAAKMEFVVFNMTKGTSSIYNSGPAVSASAATVPFPFNTESGDKLVICVGIKKFKNGAEMTGNVKYAQDLTI